MRRVVPTTAAFILTVAGTSFAQGFIQYTSRADFFAVSFPGEPNVQETPWMSEQGITLPAHVYSVENERGRYSMTVVDYKDTEKLHTERAAQCVKAKGEGDACNNGWRCDVAGAIAWGDLAVPPARCQGDVLRLVRRGPRARTMAATPQPGRITHVRRRQHARHAALSSRSDRATRCARSRTVSAVADVPRRRGPRHPLPDVLLAEPLRRMEVPRPATTAREVIVVERRRLC